jgi:hypothetical protein
VSRDPHFDFGARLLLCGAGLLWAACTAVEAGDTPALLGAPVRARVIQVDHPGATVEYLAQPAVVQDMVRRGLLQWTGKTDLREAWLSLVSPTDVVGLKVFSAPGANSGTRPAVVEAVVQGLLQAGLPASNIIIWDQRLVELRLAGFSDLASRYHVRLAGSADTGFDETVRYTNSILGTLISGDLEFDHYGATSGRYSYVSKLLTSNITKIISIAPLLNHNLAGVSGHLFSTSLGSVDNTSRFTVTGGRLALAVPEIYAMRAVGDKVALNITDALICQYLGEETSMLHYSTELNQIWISKDPVALDTLSVEELDRERRANDMESKGENPELFQNAVLLQLGVGDVSKIKLDIVK